MMNEYRVYAHLRKTDGKVFYVGKGSQGRPWTCDGRSEAWHFERMTHGYEVKILFENLSNSQALKYERLTIIMFHNLGYPLVNVISVPRKLAFRIHKPL